MTLQHIIWDWNGTLLDDLELCLEIINGMLKERELPAITRESYLEVFDFPVKNYYQKLGFDFSLEPFEAVSDQFIQAYERGRPECQLMDGSREILAALSSRRISQSILSASRRVYLTKAVQEYGIESHFNSIEGLDNHHAAGKLELAYQFLEFCPFDPAEMLLVGDTTHDGDIARALGVDCMLIPNGHHSRERLAATGLPVLNSLLELKGLFP